GTPIIVGAQSRAFIAGIRGVSTAGTDRQMVVVDADGQLGSQAVPGGGGGVAQTSMDWTTAFSITSTNITLTLVKTGRQVTMYIPAFTASLPTPAATCSFRMVPEAYRSSALTRAYTKIKTGGSEVDCAVTITLTQ